jgi:hypothetical protein
MATLKRFPFHFILLLLFFLSHGYSEYTGLIPFADLLVFFLAGAAIGLLLFFGFKKLFRSGIKAGFITTFIFFCYLFFGSIKDALHIRYSILLPLMLVTVVAAIFYLNRSRKTFSTLTLFINSLLLIYLLVDVGMIAFKKPKNEALNTRPVYAACDTCAKPDIYLILLDEYTGTNELQNYFHYNNHPFEDALRQRGFFVANNPSSNYSATAVSMASLFSMDYLPEFHRHITVEDYTRAENVINQSMVMLFLERSGYQFLNHSILNLRGQPGQFTTDLMPKRLKLITAKTMWNRLNNDVAWISPLLPDDYKHGNQRLIKLTTEASVLITSKPRFIYTHLLMPHWPYLVDSTGKETGINFHTTGLSAKQKESAYVQYLAYTNHQMLQLADTIMNRSKGKAAIIIMSDHGYRERKVNGCRELTNNFISVYLPGKDYRYFYDGMSNVNLFPMIFNTLFQQQIARLPDKCIF